MKFRQWQDEGYEVYKTAVQQGRSDILIEATPGAGKTRFAYRVCLHQLEAGSKRLLFVVPTRHLKVQWAKTGELFGLDIRANFHEGHGWPKGAHGIAVTYHQVSEHAGYYHNLICGATAVLDELHHAGDGLSWGEAVRHAAGDAALVLGLSGTAFRSDNATIPFVQYVDGKSQPDYVYSYGRAISDGVCRPVAFLTYGGSVNWRDEGEQKSATFADALDEQTASKRLRVALEPSTGWVRPMLSDAHQMLMELRATWPTAAGLVVAADQEHAHKLAKVLGQVSGSKPVVVVSDNPAASQAIEAFSQSDAPWIVACNMVSEGVDIPRLAVGVYCTTILTKMYFRQFIGRIVRAGLGPARAYCYLPADMRLALLASEVEEEQRHYIDEVLPRDREQMQVERRTMTLDGMGGESAFDGAIVGGHQLALWGGAAQSPIALEQGIREHRGQMQAATAPGQHEQDDYSNHVRRLVGVYCSKSNRPFQAVYAQLNKLQNVRHQGDCTPGQLRARAQTLEKWLSRF